MDVLAAFKQLNHDSEYCYITYFPKLNPHPTTKFNKQQTNSINKFIDYLSKNTVIIDGIFGTGLNKAYLLNKDTISFINNLPNTVISVDVPSGITETNNSDSIKPT